MAERVVDLFEAVEVEQRNADLARAVGEQAIEPLLHGVEDSDDAARGKMVEPDRVLELGDQRAGEENPLNFSGGVRDRTRDRKHPFVIAPIAHGIADRDRLAAQGLPEIVAVGDIVARARGRSDVLAIGADDGDVGYEARQLRLQSGQQHK